MTPLEREERFSRGCTALAGLRDLLAGSAPGSYTANERLACLIELIENDLIAGTSPRQGKKAIND